MEFPENILWWLQDSILHWTSLIRCVHVALQVCWFLNTFLFDFFGIHVYIWKYIKLHFKLFTFIVFYVQRQRGWSIDLDQTPTSLLIARPNWSAVCRTNETACWTFDQRYSRTLPNFREYFFEIFLFMDLFTLARIEMS